jgi:hypothetical protein
MAYADVTEAVDDALIVEDSVGERELRDEVRCSSGYGVGHRPMLPQSPRVSAV